MSSSSAPAVSWVIILWILIEIGMMTVLKAAFIQEMLDHGYPFPIQITFWLRFLGMFAYGMSFILCVAVEKVGSSSWTPGGAGGGSLASRNDRDREYAEKLGWSLYYGNIEMLKLAAIMGLGMSAEFVLWVYGLYGTSLSNFMIICSSGPIYSMLIEHLIDYPSQEHHTQQSLQHQHDEHDRIISNRSPSLSSPDQSALERGVVGSSLAPTFGGVSGEDRVRNASMSSLPGSSLPGEQTSVVQRESLSLNDPSPPVSTTTPSGRPTFLALVIATVLSMLGTALAAFSVAEGDATGKSRDRLFDNVLALGACIGWAGLTVALDRGCATPLYISFKNAQPAADSLLWTYISLIGCLTVTPFLYHEAGKPLPVNNSLITPTSVVFGLFRWPKSEIVILMLWWCSAFGMGLGNYICGMATSAMGSTALQVGLALGTPSGIFAILIVDVFVMNKTVNMWQIMGAICVIAGVFVAAYDAEREAQKVLVGGVGGGIGEGGVLEETGGGVTGGLHSDVVGGVGSLDQQQFLQVNNKLRKQHGNNDPRGFGDDDMEDSDMLITRRNNTSSAASTTTGEDGSSSVRSSDENYYPHGSSQGESLVNRRHNRSSSRETNEIDTNASEIGESTIGDNTNETANETDNNQLQNNGGKLSSGDLIVTSLLFIFAMVSFWYIFQYEQQHGMGGKLQHGMGGKLTGGNMGSKMNKGRRTNAQ